MFALLFPILVLAYSYNKFKFSRDEYLLNMEVLPPGSFERRARMIADPAQIALFRVGLDSLRIKTLSDLFLRIGMNLSFCNRLKRVVNLLIAQQKKANSANQRVSRRLNSFHSAQQKPVTRSLALVFLLFSLAVVLYAFEAVGTSRTTCEVFPQCVVYSFRWKNAQLCPCLTLVDADRAPTTYEEWANPIDATATVRALAASGNLQVIQLINRLLLRWPEELERCSDLNYVYVETVPVVFKLSLMIDSSRLSSLIYTGVEEIPRWMKDMKKLEYL